MGLAEGEIFDKIEPTGWPSACHKDSGGCRSA